MPKKYVVYDSMNSAVWVDNRGKFKDVGPRKHMNNRQARSAAIQEAKRLNYPVYDKYYGKFFYPSGTSGHKRQVARRQRSANPSFTIPVPFSGGWR